MNKLVRRLRRTFFWQMTVTDVRFIDGDGVKNFLHIHPAWHSDQRIFEDALAIALPGKEQVGEAERPE